MTLAVAEEKFIFQRARVKWVECGDFNSAYFHRAVSTRKAMNQIHYLVDSDGHRLETLNEVKSHCMSFYEDLLGGPSLLLSPAELDQVRQYTPFRCSASQSAMLEAEISDSDIKREIFAMPANKTPGPDGYTGEFYRASWDIISYDVISAVKEFFRTSNLLKQWNATALSLIPKTIGADRIGSFRPISCCNVIYKVISKIIARRLQSLLPSMISTSQSAFVKGRLLVENVLLATEMVQGFGRTNISPRGLLKVDLRKAFDCVKWDFVIQILKTASFPPKLIKWVEQCLTTTSFSLNINGELCGFFRGGKGLRQGDPLSPTLFVIAMEILSNMLNSKFADGSIGYHPLGRNPVISHLAFADDLMIFFDGQKSSLQEITALLDRFKELSGLSMNRDKSTLFLAGLSPQELNSLSHFGLPTGTFPVRYLGLPLLHRKLRKADYSPLLDMVKSKFTNWSAKLLSFAGRLQLISSVIYSMVNFWASAFALPKGCLKAIQTMCNSFLWAGNMDKRASSKVSWHDLCLPKAEGGLGLRDFDTWNKVLNLKLVWFLFMNSGSIWVAWMKEHMLNNRSYWTAEENQSSSWIWRFLIGLKPKAKQLLGCKLGDGKKASYWYDDWCSLGPLIDVLGVDGPRLMGIPIEATVSQGTNLSGWRVPSTRTRNPLLLQVRNALTLQIAPRDSMGPDSFLWGPRESRKGFFSTKVSWNLLRPSSSVKSWRKAVWFKRGIPKHSFNFWVANLNRLPLKTRLSGWGLNISTDCDLCLGGIETRNHLFFNCPYSTQVWSLILNRLGLPMFSFGSWEIMISWLLGHTSALPSTLKKLVTQATIYFLWKERNMRIHDGVHLSPEALFHQIDRTIRDALLAIRYRKQGKGLLSKWFAHHVS